MLLNNGQSYYVCAYDNWREEKGKEECNKGQGWRKRVRDLEVRWEWRMSFNKTFSIVMGRTSHTGEGWFGKNFLFVKKREKERGGEKKTDSRCSRLLGRCVFHLIAFLPQDVQDTVVAQEVTWNKNETLTNEWQEEATSTTLTFHPSLQLSQFGHFPPT